MSEYGFKDQKAMSSWNLEKFVLSIMQKMEHYIAWLEDYLVKFWHSKLVFSLLLLIMYRLIDNLFFVLQFWQNLIGGFVNLIWVDLLRLKAVFFLQWHTCI